MSAFIASTQRMKRLEVVLGVLRLAHAVDDHPVAQLLGPAAAPAPREDVHLDVARHELLRQLADVARQPALDDRRVLRGPARPDRLREYPPIIEGGLARHVRKLAEQLVARDIEVHVLTRGGAAAGPRSCATG